MHFTRAIVTTIQTQMELIYDFFQIFKFLAPIGLYFFTRHR